MPGISSEELSKLWNKSLISTEMAIFNMIRTILILTLALKKRQENSNRLLEQSRRDITRLLKSMADMQKIRLEKLDIYLHFLDRDEREEIAQIMNIEEDQTAIEEIQSYISPVLECFHGLSDATHMGFPLSEVLQHLTRYDVQKNLLCQPIQPTT
jgi:hypothetical protein